MLILSKTLISTFVRVLAVLSRHLSFELFLPMFCVIHPNAQIPILTFLTGLRDDLSIPLLQMSIF